MAARYSGGDVVRRALEILAQHGWEERGGSHMEAAALGVAGIVALRAHRECIERGSFFSEDQLAQLAVIAEGRLSTKEEQRRRDALRAEREAAEREHAEIMRLIDEYDRGGS